MRALVTGATGFIGRRLVARLEAPVVLSRSPEAARRVLGDVRAFAWDPEAGPPPADAFDGVDTVFHLAGEPVAGGRWTAERKARIRSSREQGTRHLVTGLQAASTRPAVLVSASAVGYYGDRGDQELDESAAPGAGFLAEVCRVWEDEAVRAREAGLRVVPVRSGIVLGEDGGALGRLLPLFRAGLGGTLGGGDQWMPWVHVDDVVGLMLHAAATQGMDGPANAVAPGIVRNREFTRALASALGRPAFLPVPSFALHLALGEFGESLTHSQRVVPAAARSAGYAFAHPALAGALTAVLSTR
jgi:uncharacterized protein (TIGR01777 family)